MCMTLQVAKNEFYLQVKLTDTYRLRFYKRIKSYILFFRPYRLDGYIGNLPFSQFLSC